ncbi:MAG TPA: glycosyltransferase family 2 protein [bacterium]|nr:MAG: putative glycosyltransferase EpsJ [bacterium ADurb.Bin236]HOY63298.1 glycosyltransferase family 2 protein [bacterium]HPI76256.1 glycosyltransferase family 2 protein [bacterium]HPN94779.1 glycosyltransferase family 2 protein [bacterium]
MIADESALAWSFVVPNYNGEAVIAACVDAMLAAAARSRFPGEIIIVDDASSDRSADIIAQYSDRAKLIRLEKNCGFSTACNAGISAARGSAVILINNDVSVYPDIIDIALASLQPPDVFAVSFRALDENGNLRIGRTLPSFKKGFLKGAPDERETMPDADTRPAFFASGGGAAFGADKLRALGGFDENMNPFYWEDVDLSFRALRRGWNIVYDPACVVLHPSHGVISSSRRAREVNVISRRNQLIFFWKNADCPRMWAGHIFFVALKALSGCLTFRFDYLKSLAGAARLAGPIAAFRRKEKKLSVRSSRDIIQLFR